jgi:hypothetical protein
VMTPGFSGPHTGWLNVLISEYPIRSVDKVYREVKVKWTI